MEPIGKSEVTKPTHPKAVGDVLKHITQKPEKYHVQPSPTPSKVTTFTKGAQGKRFKWQPSHHAKNAFFCELCDVSCNGPDHLQHHLIGKKHKKNVMKQSSGNLAEENFNSEKQTPPQPVAKIQSSLKNLSRCEPILGLEFITEVVYDKQEIYNCGLCRINVPSVFMESHLIGSRHRKKHMEKFYPGRCEQTPWLVKDRRGKTMSSAMREYAKEITPFLNGSYTLGKIKVVMANNDSNSFKFKIDETKSADGDIQRMETNISNKTMRMQQEIKRREQAMYGKERLLEDKEQQAQRAVEAKLRERKRLLWEKEEREKQEKQLADEQVKKQLAKEEEEKQLAEEKKKSRENLLDMICESEKSKMLLKLQEKEETSGSVNESMITDALVEDANSRKAQREVELILNLSTSDRKILYLLMLQRKRFKTSLKKLEEIIGDKPILENERIIKTRLETALEKMKSDARQILSTALWMENDDDTTNGNQSKEFVHSPVSKSGSSAKEAFPYTTSTARRFQVSQSAVSSHSRVHTYDLPLSHESGRHHDKYTTSEKIRSTDEYPSSSRDFSFPKQSDSVEYNNGQSRDKHMRSHQEFSSSNEKILVKSPDDAGPSNIDREKRKMMEDRIFESLCSGSLAPIAKAFSDNPTLQAALKTWEGKQRDARRETLCDKDENVKVRNHESFDSEVSFNFRYRQRRSDYENVSGKNVEENYERQMDRTHVAHSSYDPHEAHELRRDKYDFRVLPQSKYAIQNHAMEKSRVGDQSLHDEHTVESFTESHHEQHAYDERNEPAETEEYYDQGECSNNLYGIGLYDELDQNQHFHIYPEEQQLRSAQAKSVPGRKPLLSAPIANYREIPMLEYDYDNDTKEDVLLLDRHPPQQLLKRKPVKYAQPHLTKQLPSKKPLLETPELGPRRTLLQHPMTHHPRLQLKPPLLPDQYSAPLIVQHPMVKVSQRPVLKVPLLAHPSVRPKQALLRRPTVGLPGIRSISAPPLHVVRTGVKRRVPLLQSPVTGKIPVKKPLLSRPPPLLQDPE
uniref:Uncharacterized protein zf(U1like)-5 n=1 Tax=Phallusia mammillata TaxID=59560 RepID=A0A6F9DY21_9ASCI|nr:uncharacterized protein zf(u1like)-5 [Phallusia mammillata]